MELCWHYCWHADINIVEVLHNTETHLMISFKQVVAELGRQTNYVAHASGFRLQNDPKSAATGRN